MSLITLQKGKQYRVLQKPHLPILSVTTKTKGSKPGQVFVTTISQTLPVGTILEFSCHVEGNQLAFMDCSVPPVGFDEAFIIEDSRYIVGELFCPSVDGNLEEVTNG